jgi:hypothetical protein
MRRFSGKFFTENTPDPIQINHWSIVNINNDFHYYNIYRTTSYDIDTDAFAHDKIVKTISVKAIRREYLGVGLWTGVYKSIIQPTISSIPITIKYGEK